MRGRSFFRMLIFVPYVLSEVIAGVAWLLHPAAGRADRRAARQRSGSASFVQLWLADPDIVLWTMLVVITWKYIGFAIILFLAGLQGIPEELHRGRADRRRQLVADPAAHHDPAARPDHPDLGVPVDHRLAAAVRPGLDHDRRRPGQRAPSTMATYMVDFGFQPLPVRLRQRRRGDPLRHLVRRRAASTSASCCAATPRARSPEGWADMAATQPAMPTRRTEPCPGRPLRLEQPLIYVVALVVVAITVVPVALRRSSAASAPPGRSPPTRPGCPTPGSSTTTSQVLHLGRFWTQVAQQHDRRAGDDGRASSLLGVMAAFVLARYEFRGREALYTLFTARPAVPDHGGDPAALPAAAGPRPDRHARSG